MEEEYIYQIQTYNLNLTDYEQKLKQIKSEIEESEAALASARKYSDRFYTSIGIKRSKGNELLINNGLNALAGWANQINNLLTGVSFHKADNSLNEMIDIIKSELKKMYDEYDYYEGLIKNTKINLSNAQTEFETYKSQNCEKGKV